MSCIDIIAASTRSDIANPIDDAEKYKKIRLGRDDIIEVLEVDETPAYGLETKVKVGINGVVEWNAAAPTGFDKFFNNDMVSGINYDMKKIDGGAVMCGYGSASWE